MKTLSYKCDLKTDKNVRPVQQRLRRQPYQLRAAIKTKLRAIEKEGLIGKVDSPQEWLSNSELPVIRTSRGPKQMVRLNECST